MCGLAGVWDERGGAAVHVANMARALRLRGPDEQAQWHNPADTLAFGHTRLAVQDLSAAGAQPMSSADGRYTIAYNGEVYNFRELGAELAGQGRPLRGGSDTEVLLEAISHWGLRAALERCVGMFAFALYDAERHSVTLVRDRLGIKPLYYCHRSGSLLFGSTLAALRAHPDCPSSIAPESLAGFLRYGYVRGADSIVAGIRRVEPGTMVQLEAGGALQTHTYWRLDEVIAHAQSTPFTGAFEAAVEQLDSVLGTAVRQRLVSDVPLGAFLSGGIDSTLIVALMQRHAGAAVRTFTIGFAEADYDEATAAAAVARHLGTNHTSLQIDPQTARDIIPKLPTIFDEPFADPSQIPSVLVAQLARRDVTVALSGDGGDELFGGYRRYADCAALWQRLARFPAALRAPLARLLLSVPASRWDRLLRRLGGITAGGQSLSGDRLHKLAAIATSRSAAAVYDSLQALWDNDITQATTHAPRIALVLPERPLTERLMHADTLGYLPDDILTKVDRASMAVSLEARVPLLDHRVVEFAWQLPLDYRRDAQGNKRLPRALLERYVPPQLTQRPKQGFAVPLDSWLRGPLRDWADDLLAPARLRRSGLLNGDLVARRWQEHRDGSRQWHRSLWCVLMFEAWRAAQGL